MKVKFATLNVAERAAARVIMERAAAELAPAHPIYGDRTNTLMNLQAVHYHTPLRLEDLAKADTFNFAHDIGGIERHIDKETGQLTGCFLPRFHDSEATPQAEQVAG